MAYHFYIQKNTAESGYSKVDIESAYNCKYKQFQGIFWNGDVQNSYAETFAEKDGEKIWLPQKDDITHAPYDCTLELLFIGDDCQENARRFFENYQGVPIEYSDTFRNLFIPLVLLKQPSISQEKLYGNRKYILASFSFRNYKGRSYTQSQINK